MKVTVRNLGIIQEAVIDLKPLTVFIGPNSSGKTWLAYTLAGVLGQYGIDTYNHEYVFGNVPEKYSVLDKAVQQIIDKGSTKIDLVDFADIYGEGYLNNVARLASHWITRYMKTDQVSFSNLNIQVDLTTTKQTLLERILRGSLTANLSKSLLTALKKEGDRELYLYTSTKNTILDELPIEAVKRFVLDNISTSMSQALYNRTYIFPTERSANISLPGFRPERTLSSVRDNEILIHPIEDFLQMLTTISLNILERRREEAQKNKATANYLELAQLLETSILGGSVYFSGSPTDILRKLFFQPTNGHPLEIAIASSMVKELAPLVLYLQYLAEPGALLVIDEPEMNLHPEGQAKIAEFLAMLVNAGLNILITTHSPYIVDHLGNLMEAFKNVDPDSIRDKFYLKQTQAFISKDKLSSYLINNGTAKNIVGDDGIIYWDTFSDVSDQVTRIYFEL